MQLISDIAENEICFYDLETDHQYPAQAAINLIGVKYGFEGKYEKVKSPESIKKFKSFLRRRDVLKVGFNCCNFDNIILERHGFHIEEEGMHDGYLMMKALCPRIPSYSLKFLCFWFLGDPHWPEMRLEAWAKRTQLDKWSAPDALIEPYLAHDLEQHKDIFCLAWENIQKPEHWKAYKLDLSQAPIVLEMATEGGIFIDREANRKKIAILQKELGEYTNAAYILSDGAVENPNSSKQMGAYLDDQGFALELSANGEFAVRKSDLVDIREHNPVAECSYQVRKINGTLKYFENYAKAIEDSPKCWIPVSVSISAARTRRYTSSSLYGLNYQNPNEDAKSVQIVPEGWLGWWIDATGIENVVHIYESQDDVRRRAYEADPDWSEYVWLCNRILGGKRSKKELDAIPSPQIPNWSIYKQYKTVKLALNFGMGVRKFCKTTGVERHIGKETFDTIHDVCPAIRQLQDDVGQRVTKYGYVEDVFGHRYEDSPDRAYKLVAYLVQGCGTGSLPKAQMRANYETIHQFDNGQKYGLMSCTCHDENSGRLDLCLGFDRIFAILQEINYNMTKKFSWKFDNIPLRAKLYLSRTTAAAHEEVAITDVEKIKSYCT